MRNDVRLAFPLCLVQRERLSPGKSVDAVAAAKALIGREGEPVCSCLFVPPGSLPVFDPPVSLNDLAPGECDPHVLTWKGACLGARRSAIGSGNHADLWRARP